jgi:hypothetical protein
MNLAKRYALAAGSKSKSSEVRFTRPKKHIPCVQPPNSRFDSDRRERVLQIINDIRREVGLPLVG